MQLISPAKINLFLRVLRRREDGYHELASLFQMISLSDIINISLSSQDVFTCSNPAIPTGSANLSRKAAELFRVKTGKHFHFNIHLQKNIPSEAGLGGGSSNAATTLKGLNQLLDYPATLPQLMEWAAEIGSDVPFFLTEGTAYVTGRGDVIQPLSPLPKPKSQLWIIKPHKGLSTPAVYKALQVPALPKRNPKDTIVNFLQGVPEYFNDLEIPAFNLLPELVSIKQTLVEAAFTPVLLSGSGSALFCMGNKNPAHLLPSCTVYSADFFRSDIL